MNSTQQPSPCCTSKLIPSGLVTLFLAFLIGHEGTYRQYLAVVAHAHLIAPHRWS